MSAELSEEFDTGVEEDEILARGGHYSLGTVPGTTGKALILLGAIVAIFGIVFELMIHGYIYPLPNYLPTPLGMTLILAVPVVGVVILLAGIGVSARTRRDPPLEPIV